MLISCSGHRLHREDGNGVGQMVCFLLLPMYSPYHSLKNYTICDCELAGVFLLDLGFGMLDG